MLPTLDSVQAYSITTVACVRADWLRTGTEVQEDPSGQYQRPIHTALRNTWRLIRTVTFVETLPYLRHFQ